MIEDRTGIGGLIKEKIARFRRIFVHKLNAKEITVGTIKERVSGSGVTFDNTLNVDAIAESTAGVGVTVDGVLLKDGVVTVGDVAFDDATSDPLAVAASAADGTENSVARKDHAHAMGILTTRGDLLTRDASNPIRLAVGAANTVLWTDGTDSSWSAAPRLANIADTAGTNRLTLAAASPHVKVTGDLHVSGNTGERLRVGPLAPSGDNLVEATTKTGSYGGPAEVNFFKASHLGSGILVGTWALVRGFFGYPIVNFASGSVYGQVYGLQFNPKVVGGGGDSTITEMDAIRATYEVGSYSGTIDVATGAEIEAPALSGVGWTITLSTGAHIGNFGNNALIADAYGLKIDDMTINTGFQRLIEAGPATPYLRLVGGGDAAAFQTNLYLKEAANLRQVRWMDPGAGGGNFAGGELVMILV